MSPRSIFLSRLALLAGLGFSSSAWAACEIPAGVLSNAALDRALDRLADCQKDPAYLAALGHALNEKGRYVEAGDHLERALMLAPQQKGAQVDYAIALAGAGDLASASALVESLLREPDLPPALRPVLERQQAAWRGGAATQLRFVLNTRLGYDSNLLGAPNLSSLALTFPGQTVVLPLEGYQRRPGIYARFDAQVEARREVGVVSRWDAYAGLRSRRSGAVSEAGSDQLDAALQYNDYQRAATGRGFYAGAAVTSLRARTGIEYRAQALSFGLGTLPAGRACDTKLGIDLQNRDYLSNPVLSGRYIGASAVWSCEASRRVQWLASVKAGVDRARNADRPGGDQDQFAVRAGAVFNAVGIGEYRSGQLLVDAEINRSRDRSGYSALLESGRLRDVRRFSGRVEYQYMVRPGLQWIAGAEWAAQQSSLALFANRSWGPYVALRQAW